MAALLVALAVMSVLMSAVLPAWRHQATREKEAELIFRGEQYVRAISLWERRHGPGTRPPNVDVLVQQKFLRKKYKDPMTADGEFQLLFAGVNPVPGVPGGQRGEVPGGQRGEVPGGQRGQVPGGQTGQVSGSITFGVGSVGGTSQMVMTPQGRGSAGLFGVASKSREVAIRIYPPPGRQVPGVQGGEGRRYNEWLFVHAGAAAAPGGGPTSPQPGTIGPPGSEGRGRGGIGPGRGRSGRGIGPGGRGMPPGGRGFGPGGRGTPGPNRADPR